MPAVEVSHIVKSFADKVAVDDLSFSVVQGEIFGLIGPNGDGKTATYNLISVVLKPTSVKVILEGKDGIFRLISMARIKNI